jgi:hypothetical protein
MYNIITILSLIFWSKFILKYTCGLFIKTEVGTDFLSPTHHFFLNEVKSSAFYIDIEGANIERSSPNWKDHNKWNISSNLRQVFRPHHDLVIAFVFDHLQQCRRHKWFVVKDPGVSLAFLCFWIFQVIRMMAICRPLGMTVADREMACQYWRTVDRSAPKSCTRVGQEWQDRTTRHTLLE